MFPSRNQMYFVLCLLLGITLSLPLAASGDPQPQVVLPIFDQTDLDPNDTYVTPSVSERLEPGARLDLRSDFELFVQTPFVVQRLTERTYWLGFNAYAATVYVGDRGVLMIDCGGHGGPPELAALLAGLSTITDRPLTHLVLSHPHSDHVGNSVALQQMFPRLEIIASVWAAEAIEEFGYSIAEPTRVVRRREGHFIFEGKKFRMVTPTIVGHTSADSYIVTPDRVLHVVDIIQAGRLPFLEGSVVQSMDGYLKILRRLAGEEGNYDFINPGHLNVAYARDVETTLSYYEALYRAWWASIVELDLASFIDPSQDNVAVWLRTFFDEISEAMFFRVAPDFGHLPFIEVGRDHAQKVHEHLFLQYLNGVDPSTFGRIPSFEPIPPGR